MKASQTKASFLAGILIFIGAFAQAHTRIQTTLLGYELGELKSSEARLLENRSQLQMEYAKITTKKNLKLLAGPRKSSTNLGEYAVH